MNFAYATTARKRRVLGPEHPETLDTMMRLANGQARQGRYGEAEKLQLETLATARRVLGTSHPLVGRGLYNWAVLALRRGDRRKALDSLREAVDHRLGPGDVNQMQEDDELKPLRGDPGFDALVAEARKRATAR